MAGDLLREPSLGLYVHLPWCVSKCPYCDFNSHALRGELPAEAYVDRLLADLDEELPRIGEREVSSVYFGGGTPSLFPAAAIATLLEQFAARTRFSSQIEITLEANPGTVERDSFTAYREAGVNRVSLGVQSFNDEQLRRLGRIHDQAAARDALESLAGAGLTNFNIDLMFGLPGQSEQQAVSDIEMALSANPAHLSHYQLTLEPNTAFAHAPPELPDEDACWSMQEACEAVLLAHGFDHYEVSAWARPGARCMHNVNYWRYGDFLGLGAGAHSKLTDSGAGRVERWFRPRHPKAYLAGAGVEDRRVLDSSDIAFEFFLNRLRLREEFSEAEFQAATGLSWPVVSGRVAGAIEAGLMASDGKRYRTTELGRRFLNDVQVFFLP